MGVRPPARWSARWAARAAIVLAVLIVAELLLHLFAPWEPGDIEIQVDQDLPGVKPAILYTENAFGFRSASMTPQEKPQGTVRVLCLGASSTQQPTQATEDIWCSLLQPPLEFALGVDVETAALGRGGWTARDLWVWASEDLARFEPDVVVTLLGINDLCFNGGPGYTYENFDDIPLDWTALGKRACLSWSQLCPRAHGVYTHLSAAYRARRDGAQLEWHSRNLPNLREALASYPFVQAPHRSPDPLVEFTDSTAALADLLRQSETGAVFLGQPVLWHAGMDEDQQGRLWFPVNTPEGFVRTSPEWLAREMDRYDRAQQTAAEEAGFVFVDLDSEIPRTLDHFFDDCHFTDQGNLRVAQSILPIVADQAARAVSEHRGGKPDGP